jgi:uncharacterized HAD superfamily protein
MKKIAVDIDGVLANLMVPLLEYHNQRFDTNFRYEDVNTFDLGNIFGLTEEELIAFFNDFCDSVFFEKIQPLIDAQEGINSLSKTHELSIVTARTDKLKEQIDGWLDQFYPNLFSKIHFADKTKWKVEFCLEEDYSLLIEDDLRYANQCAEKGIKVLLMNHPWNQEDNLHPNISRVNDWKEIGEHLNGN